MKIYLNINKFDTKSNKSILFKIKLNLTIPINIPTFPFKSS